MTSNILKITDAASMLERIVRGNPFQREKKLHLKTIYPDSIWDAPLP